ncbi:hypothetical protein GBF38_006599 [Nibea albiflora]|uniref:Uncharacterized protein n=1 Tax=Nibea albiflora TaxID=240163 RepID=A0ACB7EGC4_NIBAL|nr:hypothetical protein GBF38_006599 [Nibea albiflora]
MLRLLPPLLVLLGNDQAACPVFSAQTSGDECGGASSLLSVWPHQTEYINHHAEGRTADVTAGRLRSVVNHGKKGQMLSSAVDRNQYPFTHLSSAPSPLRRSEGRPEKDDKLKIHFLFDA